MYTRVLAEFKNFRRNGALLMTTGVGRFSFLFGRFIDARVKNSGNMGELDGICRESTENLPNDALVYHKLKVFLVSAREVRGGSRKLGTASKHFR